jgi:hypothetical protein
MSKRRADLIFRSSKVDKELNLTRMKWLSLEEAMTVQNTTTDFYISGVQIGSDELVEAVSIGWKSSDEPTAVRKRLTLKDGSKNKGSKDHFFVRLFGIYAHDIDSIGIKDGEVVTIVNPTVVRRRKQPFDEEINSHIADYELYVGHLAATSKICVHYDNLPVVQVNRLHDDFNMVEEIELVMEKPKQQQQQQKRSNVQTTPMIQRQHKQPKSSSEPNKGYTFLKDCLPVKCIKTRLKILPVLTREHYTSLLHWVNMA